MRLLFALIAMAACGRSPLNAPDAATTEDAGRDGGVCRGCPCSVVGSACGLTPLVDPLELCATPRPDEEAEWLAIEAGHSLLADPGLYERAHRELAAIRAGWDAGQSVRVRPPFAFALGIETPDPIALVAAPGLQCLLRTYRANATAVPSLFLPYAFVDFEGRLDVRKLVPDFERLPGAKAAWPDWLLGDGPDICLSINDAGVATWIFDDASGDCPSGCYLHHYTGFSTTPDGTITRLGDWPANTPRPGWFPTTRECTGNL